MVLEDDTICVANALDEIRKFIRSVPSDWDMCVDSFRFLVADPGASKAHTCYHFRVCRIYLGGKHYTFWGQSDVKYDNQRGRVTGPFVRSVCLGVHGVGDSPLAPNGSRTISLNDTYWRTLETTNTHAIVYNPLKIERILRSIHPEGAGNTAEPPRPFDVILADEMRHNLRGLF